MSRDFEVVSEKLQRKARTLQQLTPEQEARLLEREVISEKRNKEARSRASAHALSAALGPRYSCERVQLSNFKIYDDRQISVVQRIGEIGAGIKSFTEQGHNLAIFGTVGTGKDHLLAFLLYRAAADGFSCRYANGQEVFASVRGTMDDRSHETERSILEDFTAPDVMAISDPLPPDGPLSPWRREILYRILEKRYRLLRPTWITANLTSRDQCDKNFTESVWDRLQDGAEVFFCDWPSFRERKT